MSTAVKLEESDIAMLCNELTDISDWFMLGLNLGVPYRLLKEIRSNYSVEGCGACRRETLVLWLQRTPNASWRNVVGALRQMGENAMAERIEQKYILASKLYNVSTCHGMKLEHLSTLSYVVIILSFPMVCSFFQVYLLLPPPTQVTCD